MPSILVRDETSNTQSLATREASVRLSTIVMIGVAVLFGLLAVFLAQSWLNSQAEQRLKSLEAQNKKQPIVTQTIVVASKALRFGAEVNASSLREIAWPEDAVPAGAFKQTCAPPSSPWPAWPSPPSRRPPRRRTP